MKRFFCLFLFFFLEVQVHAAFSDAEGSWYRDSINSLAEKMIISGFGDGTFGPRKNVTRAEMLKISFLAGGKKTLEDSRKQCFPDVSPNAWYAEYICSAKELGLANGHQDGLFRPNNPVSAHEAIAFLSRMMDAPLQDAQTDWYEPYEEYADANDLFPAERYNTNTYILRGEVTELTSRFLKKENGEKVSSLSVGCGKNPTQNLSPLLVNGVQRSFLQYIPDAYRSNTPHGLVVAVHGRTNSNAMVKNYMGLEGGKKWQGGARDQEDFLVVYPAGQSASRGTYSWSNRTNLDFIEQLVTTMAENYCIDRNKVFVVGHSLGGYFANRLACERGDIFRGMGVVGGSISNGSCESPTAGMYFHHPRDWAVPISQGETARNIRLAANNCDPSVFEQKYFGENVCLHYDECRTGNPVVWCTEFNTYRGDTHSWPNNAGNIFLDFFRSLTKE
jgi:polyhydroxybutyrate depolymerase